MSAIEFCRNCNQECYWEEYTAKDGRKFPSLRNADGGEWHFKTCVFKKGQYGGRRFGTPVLDNKKLKPGVKKYVLRNGPKSNG